MKFRSKIYLMIVGIACVSVLLALFIVYEKSKKQLLFELRSKVEAIAATGSVLVDGSLLKNIRVAGDESSPSYLKFQAQLREIRKVNQRPDVHVEYVYTLRPSKLYQGYVETVVDASNNPPSFSPTGQLHFSPKVGNILEHLNQVYSPDKFTVTRWGTFLSGFAPIYNSQGEYVATLGVDVNVIRVFKELYELLYFGLYALVAAAIIAFILAQFLSKRTTRVMQKFCLATHEIGNGNLDHELEIITKDEFSLLARKINEMAQGLRERVRLKTNFSRYVSKHILEKLVHMDLQTKGEYRKLTILFADIRGFTKLSEKLPPEDVVHLLNEYFDRMLHVIFQNNGTLDKFIGDGIMVDFGSPLDDSNQEENAVKTAIEMQKALKELCDEWEAQGRVRIEVGIGIHTGGAVVGNIGSEKRMEYAAIGDTVNIASRLEHESKALGNTIIISENTYSAIQGKFKCKSLGKVDLSGRKGLIEIYALDDECFKE